MPNESIPAALRRDVDFDAYEAVMAALHSLDIVRETHPPIELSVKNGIATISGVVSSHVMHRAILYKIATAAGVYRVVDHLYEDHTISLAVVSALAADPLLGPHQPDIAVASYLGVVTLDGVPAGAAEQERAHQIAAGVAGVRHVILRPGNA